MINIQSFLYKPMKTMEEVRLEIQRCEGHHVQQVCYSTFMDGLTQVCFNCRIVRSNIATPEGRDGVSMPVSRV